MRTGSGAFLNVLRWIIAAFMWLMALGTLTFGGIGILGAILFAIFGFIVSPLSSKYLFPKFPNLKKSHKILGAAGIWLAANIFMGVAVPSTTDSNISTVAESTTEVVERSMPTETNNGESDEASLTTANEEDEAKKKAEEEAAKKAEEETAKKAEEEAAKKAEEEAAKKAAEEVAAKKAAEEEAAKKATEEAEAQKAAEEAAAQKAAEEAAQKAAEEAAAAQKVAEEAAAQQVDSSTVANGTESASALAVLQMGPTTGSPCWVPRNGGQKYHSNSGCSGMDDPIYTTVDTATACGFDACKRCH